MKINDLKSRVEWVWRETLSIHRQAPETRIASSLSPIEVFVSLFYGGLMVFNPKEPLSDSRDRLIVSKGHGSICLYPILADLGFFSSDELNKICKPGGILGGIPDPIIPGYETVNGSLGHGLGVATGVALAQKRKQTEHDVFVLTGDGELHEGACWEAIMLAAHLGLDNLCLIVDNNAISMLGYTDDIVAHRSIEGKLVAFGWDVSSVDGHDIEAVHNCLNVKKSQRDGRPKAVVANTLKGRGVPGLENQPLSHIINPKREVLDEILGSQ